MRARPIVGLEIRRRTTSPVRRCLNGPPDPRHERRRRFHEPDCALPAEEARGFAQTIVVPANSRTRASAKEGIDQVGCVYTARGFEFDYVGVIFGPDLVYRPMDGGWVGQRHESRDRIVSRGVTDAEFTAFVKGTYRVLLTRGLRGCCVFIVDSPTRDFVLGRTEGRNGHLARVAENT